MLFAIGGLDSDVLTVEQAASEAIVYIIMLIASYLISLVTAEACGDDFDR